MGLHLKQVSIKRQLAAALILVILTFLGISTLNYWYSIRALQEKITEEQLRVLSETAQNVSQLFNGIQSRAREVKYDVNVQKVLLEDFTESGYDGFTANEQAQKAMRNIVFSWEYLKSIYVVPTGAQVRNKTGASGFIRQESALHYEWYRHFHPEKPDETWIQTHMSEDETNLQENMYTYVLPITHLYDTKRILGHVFLNVKESSLYSILRSNAMEEQTEIRLLDEGGRLFYSSGRKYDEPDDACFSLDDLASGAGCFYKGGGSGKRLVTYTTIPGYGWKLVSTVPFSEISEELGRMQGFIFAELTLCALLLGFGTMVVYRGISRPLSSLTARLARIGKGDFTPSARDPQTQNELALIHDNVNRMAEQIVELMAKNSEITGLIKDAEMKALQAQINPHFLYNALDTINWLAIANKEPEISFMVTNLSKFYKNGLNCGKELITIEAELANARSFLEIERYNYQDRFEVNFNVDKRLLSCFSIKLILQPFVENAVLHAFGDAGKKGWICVQLFSRESSIYFEVIDNGSGMTKEQIDRVLIHKTAGYGIANVNERIRLKYGPPYGVTLQSEPLKGTTASIRIPIITDPDEHGRKTEWTGG